VRFVCPSLHPFRLRLLRQQILGLNPPPPPLSRKPVPKFECVGGESHGQADNGSIVIKDSKLFIIMN
jgi:hypothetical protein